MHHKYCESLYECITYLTIFQDFATYRDAKTVFAFVSIIM